jgi:peptidyl-Asp metalloendopeptidase
MSDDRMPPEHAPMPQRLRADLPSLHDDPLVRQGDASILRSVLASLNVAGGKLPPSEWKGIPKTDPAPQPLLPVEVVIDVIVAYTKKVAENYTDVVREVVALAIEESNEAFRISGLGHIKLRPVHAYQTDYVEEGSHFDHVWRFADADDGYMEEIHELRTRHHADVAILMVDDNKGCGLATRVYADQDEAFAVVHQDCAVLTYSVAHEIGHLIGARHEINVDRAMTPFPYGHGFVNGTKWRDIMSYRESCGGCRRLPVWSNPRVLIDGERAGTLGEDNARVIAEQAARVAAFR